MTGVPLTSEDFRPPVAVDVPCGKTAPQPQPPPSQPLPLAGRWKGWEPLTCDRERGHTGQHWAGLLRWGE